MFQKQSVPWLRDNHASGVLDGTGALSDFTTYLQGLIVAGTIQAYDHAVGLTRYCHICMPSSA